MTAKHTPGPWRFEPGTNTIRSVPANYWLASMDSWDGAVRPSHAANAQLMATSPELLEAAKYLVFAMRDGAVFSRDHAAQRLVAAIAKAEAMP